jgi:hypothetical protein
MKKILFCVSFLTGCAGSSVGPSVPDDAVSAVEQAQAVAGCAVEGGSAACCIQDVCCWVSNDGHGGCCSAP